MLSVIIPTHGGSEGLVPSLAALVPGAVAGLVSDVTLVDSGAEEAVAQIADYAGCRLLASSEPRAVRLAQAVAWVRAPWLLLLAPGAVPQPGWIEEASRFVDEAARLADGARPIGVFRCAPSPLAAGKSPLRQMFELLTQAIGFDKAPPLGVLLSKQDYQRLAPAKERAGDPLAAFVRAAGRRRVVVFRCGALAI